ncbi:MAG: hypothetical protein QOE70_2434 [Chthoniobacter sp.]|jgi:hypothetical protein|nr:hypothetical protein [Chthoniobacter sp.]
MAPLTATIKRRRLGGKIFRGGGRIVAVVALLAVAGPARAQPGSEHSPDSAFDRFPTLHFIEQKLPPTATLGVPPEEGKHTANDLELQAALDAALDEMLAPPAAFAGKLGELMGAVCRYRPARTAHWMATATENVLEHSGTSRDQQLQVVTVAAVSANPAAAAGVVRSALRRIASLNPAAGSEENINPEVAAAETHAAKVLEAAMASIRTTPEAGRLLKEIEREGLREAAAAGAGYLVQEVMAAVVRGSRGIEGMTVGELLNLGLLEYGKTKEQAGLICAGAMKGAAPGAINAIKDEAALRLPVVFASYTNLVCDAYAVGGPLPGVAARNIGKFITVTNADYIPAIMMGAVAACSSAGPEIIQAGLNRDFVLRGRATTCQIVEAGVLASQKSAIEFAVASIGHGDPGEGNLNGQIAEGVARAALIDSIGPALRRQLQATALSPTEVKAIVAGAFAGAVATHKADALSEISFQAVRTSGLGREVVEQVLLSSPPDLQYAGVLGAAAADRNAAAAIRTLALGSPNLAVGQNAVIDAGTALIIDIQADPLNFHSAVLRRLMGPWNISQQTTEALVLGGGLANPKAAAAVASAAIALTDHPSEPIVAAAVQSHRDSEVGIRLAVETAVSVKAGTSDLFHFIQSRISPQPGFAPEIATGAIAVAPALAHVVGHAAALAAPEQAAAMITRLFAYGRLHDPTARLTGTPSENAAALTQGVLRGVIEAKLEAGLEAETINSVAGAAVKAAIFLESTTPPTEPPAHLAAPDHPAGSAPTPAGPPQPPISSSLETLSAVIAAAVKADPARALEIAQAAAQAARSMSEKFADEARIRDAVLAGAPGTNKGRLASAIALGFVRADLQTPAAGATRAVNSARDPATGLAVTPSVDR